MNTQTLRNPVNKMPWEYSDISQFFGQIFSFNNSLKLIHWNVTGTGSYAAHLSLDEAITTLLEVTDRIVETSYTRFGELNIVIPETKMPRDYIAHIQNFFDFIEENRVLFAEAFIQSILDDYQEGIEQLLYRLKRLQ
jgi:DNA-binding ferritin-like protein